MHNLGSQYEKIHLHNQNTAFRWLKRERTFLFSLVAKFGRTNESFSIRNLVW